MAIGGAGRWFLLPGLVFLFVIDLIPLLYSAWTSLYSWWLLRPRDVRFIGLEGFEELMTRPHLLRPAYLRIVEKYLTNIRRGCDAAGVDYVQMMTDRSLGNALAEYLVRRLQAGRR